MDNKSLTVTTKEHSKIAAIKVKYTDEWFRCNMKHFNIWYDPKTFDWKSGCLYMARYGHLVQKVEISDALTYEHEIEYTSEWFHEHADHFDKWFDVHTFNYAEGLGHLISNFPHKFNTWYVEEKVNVAVSYNPGYVILELFRCCGPMYNTWWNRTIKEMLSGCTIHSWNIGDWMDCGGAMVNDWWGDNFLKCIKELVEQSGMDDYRIKKWKKVSYLWEKQVVKDLL